MSFGELKPNAELICSSSHKWQDGKMERLDVVFRKLEPLYRIYGRDVYHKYRKLHESNV